MFLTDTAIRKALPADRLSDEILSYIEACHVRHRCLYLCLH